MGVNNQQRRAARKRKRAKTGRTGPSTGPTQMTHEGGYDYGYAGGYGGGFRSDPGEDVIALRLVERALDEIAEDPKAAGGVAHLLLGPECPVSSWMIGTVVHTWLGNAVAAVVHDGWTPSDLAEVVRRRAGGQVLPALSSVIADETSRHREDQVSAAWRADLAALESPVLMDLATPSGLESALALVAIIGRLPTIAEVLAPPGTARAATASRTAGDDHRQLSRVRALLAKAESTEYAEEAEALSAKAQELISRHALERLVQQSEEPGDDTPVVTRRIWIDSPYVVPKALLIDVVAQANRCRAVISESLGFSTIVGDPVDVESVELLSTSLLVQANTALLHHGRQVDRRGASRTKSFRRSFLTSYASRIGHRLHEATAQAVEESGRGEALLPVLRQQTEHVDEQFHQMFPDVVLQQTTISNTEGWVAGKAAADLALLEYRQPVPSAAG